MSFIVEIILFVFIELLYWLLVAQKINETSLATVI